MPEREEAEKEADDWEGGKKDVKKDDKAEERPRCSSVKGVEVNSNPLSLSSQGDRLTDQLREGVHRKKLF